MNKRDSVHEQDDDDGQEEKWGRNVERGEYKYRKKNGKQFFA